jgi:hypothetical protein
LTDLCSLLFQYHNRKTIIIIDDFDGYYSYMLPSYLLFVSKILNNLGEKESNYIEKIIMTGTLKFKISQGESSSSHFSVFNMLDK